MDHIQFKSSQTAAAYVAHELTAEGRSLSTEGADFGLTSNPRALAGK